MALRTVNIGAVAFTRADGADAFGWHGTEVDVHEDDLARFDEVNGPPAEEDAAEEMPIQAAPTRRRRR
jgi:hypothetical protein